MQETWVWPLGQEDPLEKGIGTHSSILAWRIPWTEEPRRLQSMGSPRVRHNWATNTHTFEQVRKGGVVFQETTDKLHTLVKPQIWSFPPWAPWVTMDFSFTFPALIGLYSRHKEPLEQGSCQTQHSNETGTWLLETGYMVTVKARNLTSSWVSRQWGCGVRQNLEQNPGWAWPRPGHFRASQGEILLGKVRSKEQPLLQCCEYESKSDSRSDTSVSLPLHGL